MLSIHNEYLQSYYKDKLESMKFEKPYFIKDDKESVVSNSPGHRTAFITRHYLTGDIHYSVVLDPNVYHRL